MRDLTKGNIYKTFILFAIPMVLSGLLSQGYSIVNTIIAGKLLGDGALATIGAVAPLNTFIDAVFWGYGTGVGIYAAHLFGGKKYSEMKSVMINNYAFLSFVALVISLFVIIFRGGIYNLLNIEKSMVSDVDAYFTIVMLSKPIILFAVNCVYGVNAMGDSRFPFLMSLISAVINVSLGIFFITVHNMAVESLALASALSYLIVAVLYVIKLRKSYKLLGVLADKVKFSMGVIKNTCRYSIFSMLQQSVMYVVGFLLSPMVNSIGVAASASYTVTFRIYNVNATIYESSGKTTGSYTAHCYGSKQYNLLKRGVRVGFLQNIALLAPMLLVCAGFPNVVAGLFYTKGASPESVQYTVDFMRFCLPLIVFNVVANLFHNFFRGIGDMRALFITTFMGSVARLIIGWLLIKPYGIHGYYVAWVASWLIDGLVGIIIYRFGSWRKIFVKPQS